MEGLANLAMPDLPVRLDANVRRYLHFFSSSPRGRKIFETWLHRSGRYRQLVSQALRKHQIPLDLHALVFVESGYSPAATSPAGAAGLWQFMPGTARAYDLTIERDYDERRSVTKASEAGARHLADLYERFGSWDLALGAYNMGYQGMLNRMHELGTEDFWEMSAIEGALPRETALYVPKIMAIALILRNLQHFGFDDRGNDMSVATVDVQVPGGVPISTVARAAGTSVDRMHAFNPEFLRDTIPGRGNVLVHVPASGAARARIMLPRLLDPLDRDGLEQKVGSAFDWGSDELPRGKAARSFYDNATEDDAHSASTDGTVTYRVSKDDSLESIATALGTTVDDIVKTNKLERDAKLKKGTRLRVHVTPAATSASTSNSSTPQSRAPHARNR
jgi:membrane-bound lytic murein transglycosylase D